jgi:hypothetical protein
MLRAMNAKGNEDYEYAKGKDDNKYASVRKVATLNPSRIHISLKTRMVFPFATKIISLQFYQNKVFGLSQFIRIGF